jgi:hypothetical protein
MKFTLFKSTTKRDGGLHFLYPLVVNANRKGVGDGGLTQAKSNRLPLSKTDYTKRRISVVDRPQLESIMKADLHTVRVVGCRIENEIDAFEEHEFISIARRIQETYSADVDFLIRHRHSFDTTIVVDLFIDRFSKVSMVEIIHPIISGNDTFQKDLKKTIEKWEFPAVVRQGKCRVIFSKKSGW